MMNDYTCKVIVTRDPDDPNMVIVHRKIRPVEPLRIINWTYEFVPNFPTFIMQGLYFDHWKKEIYEIIEEIKAEMQKDFEEEYNL